ncbi:hypothetical protein BZG36_04265 [Bifiguratus adelaidae]|uniref:SCP domain-containing protein n=1 Tax=Bifiguratus adelaidae TaxID=1938954 RepID=A0A261XWA7_9FUNG|nr:hypothetical protein BZG36_04265 [Bifiguratus adelaidae]
MRNSSSQAQLVLKLHNKYRAIHHAPALTWSSKLASSAHAWASQCDFKHSGDRYGENLALGYKDWNAAVGAWYDEGKHYNYNKGGFSIATGHFTQVVWKSTKQLGCAAVTCPKLGGTYYVCQYNPPGNVIDVHNAAFKRNVLKP